jgi:hypothetical protein
MNRTFSWWNGEPGPLLSLLVPAVVIALVLAWASLSWGETLRIPEDYDASRAEYLLKGQISKCRVLRGTLTMEGGKAEIHAEILTPGGLVVEIKGPVDPKGINPRKKVVNQ